MQNIYPSLQPVLVITKVLLCVLLKPILTKEVKVILAGQIRRVQGCLLSLINIDLHLLHTVRLQEIEKQRYHHKDDDGGAPCLEVVLASRPVLVQLDAHHCCER